MQIDEEGITAANAQWCGLGRDTASEIPGGRSPVSKNKHSGTCSEETNAGKQIKPPVVITVRKQVLVYFPWSA